MQQKKFNNNEKFYESGVEKGKQTCKSKTKTSQNFKKEMQPKNNCEIEMTNLLWEKVKEVRALHVKLDIVQKEKILSNMMMVLQLPTFNASSWIEMKSWRLLA